MTGINVKIIEDSISAAGKRITTMQVKFHRYILPEFNTHRVFSRNFSSSRAIPTKKLIEQVLTDPAIPVHWGKNQPGMQAHGELEKDALRAAQQEWVIASRSAAAHAERLFEIGAHKQIVNRLIEPFLWSNGIVTATEWDNWFELRAHEDAQPEIQELAYKMQEAMAESKPKLLQTSEWHLPYVTEDERTDEFFHRDENVGMLQKISAARCCRVSYLKHDGTKPNVEEDLALFERLAGSVPLHASPLEHQATPDIIVPGTRSEMAHWAQSASHGNLKGWIQYRKMWERQIRTHK